MHVYSINGCLLGGSTRIMCLLYNAGYIKCPELFSSLAPCLCRRYSTVLRLQGCSRRLCNKVSSIYLTRVFTLCDRNLGKIAVGPLNEYHEKKKVRLEIMKRLLSRRCSMCAKF
ncbi:hypothetical protein H106_05772 [Trichophyton rubrum CBS 735.88]|nr:hypothetical protein H106_05772 [Trichophyton rubrum CBS 735.88]